jgi:large subunit GTPase 1
MLDEEDEEEEDEEKVHEREDIEYVDEDEVTMLAEDIAEGMLQQRPALIPVPAPVTSSSSAESEFVWGKEGEKEGIPTSTAPTRTTSGFDTLVLEDKLRRRARVLTRRELILLLTELPIRLHLVAQDRHQGRICVGMLGYPNVGKSSAINTILAVSKSSHGES